MTGRPHEEGEEFNLNNLEQWCVISPLKGDVLFVDLASTDYVPASQLWVPFLVMSTELLKKLGTLSIEVKYLGSDDAELNKEMSSRFNRRAGRIHLCGTSPCLEDEAGCLHVTRVIWHTLAGAEGWLSSRATRSAHRWLQGVATADDAPEARETIDLEEHGKLTEQEEKDESQQRPPVLRPGILRKTKKDAKEPNAPVEPFSKKASKPQPVKPARAAPASSGKGVGSGAGAKAALDPAKVQKLREELKRSKQKLTTGGAPDPSPGGEGSGDEDESDSGSNDSTGSEGSGSAAAPKPLTAGTLMESKTGPAAAKAIKDGSTGDYHTQLIQRAAGTAELSRKATEHHGKRKRSRSPSKKASKEPHRRKDDGKKKKDSKKKKKKKKKEKKKKSRKKVTLSDGRTVSCSSSSKSSSGESLSTDEDAELEAPLRKRSQKHPGSVLNLLLEHIAEQLQQSAEVDVPSSARGDLTSGVKVVSYLALAIRPHFAHRPKELREMHNLATSIDLLRQGQLARLGDVLAGRLMAIHQSLLDASWASARHLEVMPMPEGTALGDGVLLAARKHGRQVSRAQDINLGWRTDKGRGRGKKGQQWSHYDGEHDAAWWQPKGKGKSQKKGKQKKDKDKDSTEKTGDK